MEPQGRRRISPFRVTKRSTKLRRLSKTTRSRVHVQTVGLNAETKKCRHRADGEECLLTFPFIGLLRLHHSKVFWETRHADALHSGSKTVPDSIALTFTDELVLFRHAFFLPRRKMDNNLCVRVRLRIARRNLDPEVFFYGG